MEDIKTIPLTFVNAYLIKAAEGFILIDTGLSIHGDDLEKELVKADCLPGKLKLILVTHGDLDHTGNCLRLQKKYKCKIAMHKDDAAIVENGLIIKRRTKSLRSKIFFIIRRLLRKKFEIEKFTPDIYITDGQKLDDYGLKATIIHIPGHTKGSVGVLTEDGNFFAGDTFINRKKPETANLIENQEELDKSLLKIKNLQIKMVYPGHGKPFMMNEMATRL